MSVIYLLDFWTRCLVGNRVPPDQLYKTPVEQRLLGNAGTVGPLFAGEGSITLITQRLKFPSAVFCNLSPSAMFPPPPNAQTFSRRGVKLHPKADPPPPDYFAKNSACVLGGGGGLGDVQMETCMWWDWPAGFGGAAWLQEYLGFQQAEPRIFVLGGTLWSSTFLFPS